MKWILIFIVVFGFWNGAGAQELNCTVTLNTEQLFSQQTTDQQNLSQLKTAINDFINNKRWTNDQFSTEERINCKLTINLLRSVSQGVYEGNAQLIVTRPVFGTTYETISFSFVDRNFNFTYLPSNPMYFNENNFTDELTSMLAFYAYIVLAVDYDTFNKQGGNTYVQKAFNLANLAQNGSGSIGWRNGTDIRNRYWLVENLMNTQLLPFRDGMYTYHRLALDNIGENPVLARRQIMEVLKMLQQVSVLRPNAVLVNSFFDAKGEELYKILSEATREEKTRAFAILSQLDPTQTELYRKLLR